MFDAEFHEIDSSGRMRETRWTPVRPLPRGALYQWQVTAYRGDRQEKTPTPPAADAKFRVLDANMAARIEAVRAARPPSHLLAAQLCARAGLREEARKEAGLLAAANPDSAVARQWLDSLR